MAKHINSDLKREILEAIKNGMKVSEAKDKFGVSDNAIYAWLKKQADYSGTSSLEVARLRKENTELKEIIGIFALDKRRAEKNRRRS